MIIDNKEIRINRDNAFVSEVDIAYCTLLENILSEGKRKKIEQGLTRFLNQEDGVINLM